MAKHLETRKCYRGLYCFIIGCLWKWNLLYK